MRDEHRHRLEERVHGWGLEVFGVQETATSLISFGVRGDVSVTLKVVKEPGDEWRGGEVAAAFDGAGVVQVYEYVDGAALLEWLRPGVPLADLSSDGQDERATEVLVEVISAMSPRRAPSHVLTAAVWATAFDRYLATGDARIPRLLVEEAQSVYLALCASQRETRLLHGDLHHGNVLFDYARGWVAVDPKGVIAEMEFEIGAALRNPIESPEIFGDPDTINRRVDHLARDLRLDRTRILGWAFAQAVLGTIWLLEDDQPQEPADDWLRLASTLSARVRSAGL